MACSKVSPRVVGWLIVVVVFAACCTLKSVAAEIVFDLPESIECRDATPPEFEANEYLKVIEGKLRISARVMQGSEDEIVDFMYTIRCPDKRVRFQDYLPNTTLESTVAEDQVEIRDASESAKQAGADVHVVYKLLALGGTLNHSSKNSESSHYRQIAPKELVVASGTIDREHGVFFRLRPSRAASLEGSKEFTFLATVPKSWRGDLCAISCTARASKDSLFSKSVVPAGERVAEVGMYLAGDVEAASLAEQLRRSQDNHARLLAELPPKPNVFDTISCQTASLLKGKKSPATSAADVEKAEQAMSKVKQRLRQIAR